MIFVELLYNLSLLIALSIVSGFFDKRYPRTTLTGLIVQGLLFGIVALVGMMHPMNLGAGLIFDGRSVVISLSSLFFGPISGSIAGIITIISRIIQGGSGIVPGTLVVIFSVIIGSIFHFQKKKRNEEITIRMLLYLGFTVHIVMLLMMFSLPFPIAISVIQRIGIPVIICYPLATVLIGKILSDQALNFRIIENIKASELKFRTVANYTYDLEYWKNEDQKLVYISPSCERITGYSQDEFYANPALLEKIVHPEDSESFIEHSKKVYSYEQKDDYDKLEFRIVKKDGTIVNIYYIYGPIFDSNNKFHGGRVSNRDITDRKKAEEELRFRNVILSTQQEASIDGILVVDEDANIISYNHRFIEMWDVPQEMVKKKFDEPVLGFIMNKLVNPQSFLQRIKYLNEHKRETSWDEIVLKNGWIFEHYSAPMVGQDDQYYGRVWYFRDSTKSKQAEELLRESEEKYRNLIDKMNEGIFILDEKGTILFANNALARIHGFDSPDKLLNKNFIEFVEPSVKKETLKNFANEIQSGKSANEIEVPIVSANGSIVYVLIRSSIIRYGQRIAGVNGIVSDITERKQAENALHESEERFRSLYENSTIGLYRTTPDGKIILANPTLIKMLRYSSFEELAAMNLEKEGFYTSDGRKYFIERIEKNGEVIGLKSAWIRKDKTVVYVSESSKVIRDSNGKTLYYDGTVEDITEQRKADEALRKSEEKYRGIFENVQDVYYEASIDGTLIEVSPSIEILSNGGYSRDDLIGISMYDHYTIPGGRQAFLALLQKQGSVTDYEIILENRDGSHVPCSISAKIQFDAHSLPLKIIGSLRNITERKQVENALHESEERFRSLYENSTIGLYRTTPAGKIILANPTLIKMLRYSSFEELATMNLEKEGFDTSDGRKYFIEQIEKNGEVIGLKSAWIRKDKTVVYISESSKAIRDSNGKTLYYDGTVEDITERKRVEEAILESEAKYRTMVTQSPNGIFIMDLSGSFLSVNKAMCDFLKYSEEEILSMKIGDIVPQEYLSFYKNRMATLLKGESQKEAAEYAVKGKDGIVQFIEVVSAPYYKNKEIIGIQVNSRDITERKRAEEKITFLAHSLKSINECVCITDMEDKFIFVNESFLKTYGYDENELIGKYMTIVRSPNNSPELVKEILPATLQGGWQGELWNKRKDGSEFLIFLSTTIINDKEGNPLGLIGVATDITERKRTEKELINAKEKAEESDKLKSEFLAQMSHEIRTPINAIVGNVDYLNESFGKKMDSDARECFEGIELASKRIIRTVDLVLNAAELQTSSYKQHFVKVDLNSEILNKLYQEHQLSAKKKGLEFIYTCTEKDTYIIADEYSITQIFANLIDNAIKYTKKGKVEILLGKNKTNNIIVEVKDTGIGISKQFLPRIFEVFAQEEQGYSRSFDGNGLGLTLVKKYCELNKIIMEVDSEKNIGSTFRVIFDKKV